MKTEISSVMSILKRFLHCGGSQHVYYQDYVYFNLKFVCVQESKK
jgi:hypothetical protein